MSYLWKETTDQISEERTSSFASKGSITIETSLIAPIFLSAILCMIYLLETMAISTTLSHALKNTGRELAEDAYINPYVTASAIEEILVENIGEEWLEKSLIVDGIQGIDCSNSLYNPRTGVYELCLQYEIAIPVLLFRLPVLQYEETHVVKAWNGFCSSFYLPNGKQVVYVTDHGLVYHASLDCTYLSPSLEGVPFGEIEERRNASGGKYYPCENCGGNREGDTVFVTKYGTRYHCSLECSQIKRNIHAILLEEAHGLGGCSKCVG